MNSRETDVLKKAYKIATNDLRSNYGNLGIYAGPKIHRQYWARDSFITSLGACSVGDFEIVEKNLETFIKFQRKDGHIAARVEENYHQLTLLGIHLDRKFPVALHKQTQPWATDVVDSNAWFLVAAANYIKEGKNTSWLEKNQKSLKNAADWLLERIRDNGLVYEGYTANWSDCNLRSGYIIYNNVLTWKALSECERLFYSSAERYRSAALKLEANILGNFWDEKLGYFIDRIDKRGKRYKYFYSDGNLLAVWFKLASRVKCERIFEFIDKNGLDKLPIPTGYPRLDWWNDLVNKVVFYPYRTRNIFTLWGCVSALARFKLGDKKGAIKDLQIMAEKIVEYGTCHEVLTPEGKPVDLWFYKSENRIAWTAGMYIYAYNEIF